MSFAEVKSQIPVLSEAEQEEILSMILDIRESRTNEWRKKMGAKIDSDQANWVTLEQLTEILENEDRSEKER